MATPHMANGDASSGSDLPVIRTTGLTTTASFKGRRKSTSHSRVGSEVDDIFHMLHGSDPLRVELTRLENEVRDKERELGDANAEIKALKYSDRLKEKAIEELREELSKVDGKLKATEALLETKNLEIKKINEEKKGALAAQFAAEATLRRVHAAQKDDEMPPIEAILAPLEAELKLVRQEVTKLQDDNRALDRLTKSKEAALLDAEKTISVALAKASFVDDVQNKNQELMKQIEICQEENKILDKMHRQKVAEVEKLTQTVRELEEAVLAGGAAANAVRDYQRKVQEMNEEKRTLDRELARAKVTANRVAVVVANDWKDASDKVMPVKQWLEERKYYQGEMQQLKDKLAVAERTAKAESQLKEKYQLRFKVLEERLRTSSTSNSPRTVSEGRSVSSGRSRLQSLGGTESISRLVSKKAPASPSRLAPASPSRLAPASPSRLAPASPSRLAPASPSRLAPASPLRMLRSSSAAALAKIAKLSPRSPDGGGKERDNLGDRNLARTNMDLEKHTTDTNCTTQATIIEGRLAEKTNTDNDDFVSGALYDMIQREAVSLRKAAHEKDQILKDKDDAIEMLSKKVETLSKAMEVEAKKMRREMAAMEKEVASVRSGKENDQRARRLSMSRGVNGAKPNTLRHGRNF